VADMAPGTDRDLALDHLLRGQSNDVYWHGLFGGIYLVHLRLAVQAELIAAQDLVWAGHAPTLTADLDLDGRDEVQLGAEGQSLTVDLDEGAGIGAWDLFASRLAVGSAMRRRPESYHARLRQYFLELAERGETDEPAAGADPAGDAGATTTEDAVVLLDEGLDQLLVYDRHEQRGGLVTIRDLAAAESLGSSDLARLLDEDLGDFTDTPHEIVALSNETLTVRREGTVRGAAAAGQPSRRLLLTKQFTLSGTRLEPALSIEIEVANAEAVPQAFELDLSFAWNMAGGGHNPAAWYAWSVLGDQQIAAHDGSGDLLGTTELAFGNRYEGVHVVAALSRPGRITWYPIQTVSKSEGGYESVYQSSSLHLRWPIALAAGGTQRVSVTFRATQSRDRAADERSVRAGRAGGAGAPT
jgi:4-alpha-glucanotransferase